MKVVTGACLFGTVGLTLFILGVIIWRGLPSISAEFIFAMPKENMTAGGIWPAIVGTFWLTVGTAVFALPIGVATGIYLAEYAQRGPGHADHPALDRQHGRRALDRLRPVRPVACSSSSMKFNQSLLAGALTLACLTLPVIITATEEALRQVPSDLRQASLALGRHSAAHDSARRAAGRCSGHRHGLDARACRARRARPRRSS